jgi:hypothetical protein
MIEADSVHSTPPLTAPKFHPDDEIERRLLALIADDPAAVLWLTDRIAAHAIVTRLRLVPARKLNGRDA